MRNYIIPCFFLSLPDSERLYMMSEEIKIECSTTFWIYSVLKCYFLCDINFMHLYDT